VGSHQGDLSSSAGRACLRQIGFADICAALAANGDFLMAKYQNHLAVGECPFRFFVSHLLIEALR